MERDHSLLLDEEACSILEEPQRSEFVFRWLTDLKHLLPAMTRVEVKENQRRLVAQLQAVLIGSPGPPTRCLLAHCLALLYRLGDPVSAHYTVVMAAIACLGSLYEQLGRMLNHSLKDSLVNLLKAFKNAESQGRSEVLLAVEKALRGSGAAASLCHREVYKVSRVALTDRSMGCLLELQREAVFLWSSELQNIATLCFRAFEGSTYQVRVGVARLLGTLLAAALQPRQPIAGVQPGGRARSLEEVMDMLTAGFLRGGAGFLRASGDLLKGTSSVGKDVRMGVAQACVVMVSTLGCSWLEGSLPMLLGLLGQLCLQPRASHSPADSASTRACLSFILRSTLRPLLGEKALANAATHICQAVHTHTPALEGGVFSHIMLECCLLELSRVIRSLASTAAALITDPCTALLDTVVSVLLHPVASARLAAAWCLRSIAAAFPSQRCPLLDRCAERLVALKSSPEAVAGYSAAVAALLAGAQHCSLGLPHSKAKLVLGVAEDLLRSASQNSRLSLQRTQAGWLLLSSVCTLGTAVVDDHLSHVLLLVRELDMELHRGDCFTWQVTLEGRAGALCVLKNLLLSCRDLLTNDTINRLLTPLACAVALLTKCSGLIRSYGNPLRPWTVLYKLRLYQVLVLLPPHTYQESYGVVMKALLGDLENTNQPCSDLILLPALCHHDDLVLAGPAFHSLGRASIEEKLHSSSVGGGNLENDPSSLCDGGDDPPAPLPPAVALTAAAVHLFGVLFPQAITAYRVQTLQQLSRSVNQLKGQKQQTVQTHVCAALCSLLKHLGSSGLSIGPEEAPALSLLMGALENSSPLLRCAASEGLARLRSGRDAVARSGLALAVGALYRYVGGVYSPQHLTSCLGVLSTLAQDTSSPELQTWCVHSVSVLLDLSSGGAPWDRSYRRFSVGDPKGGGSGGSSSGVKRGKQLFWIKLCKDVLSASSDCGSGAVPQEEGTWSDSWSALGACPEEAGPFSTLGWRTRSFATHCLRHLVEGSGPAHFNTSLERDLLLLHLEELVRISFMASTDPSEEVRLEGLQALLLLIKTFSSSWDPEVPGHLLLEQYQANVGAALRPAFSSDARPDVRAKACQVCSAWISSGVLSDLGDLRRVHRLLASSLADLQGDLPGPAPLYNEATVTMESLAVLHAWAEVYIVAVQRSRRDRPLGPEDCPLGPEDRPLGLEDRPIGPGDRPIGPGDRPIGPEDPEGTSEDSGSVEAGLLKLVQSDLPTLSRLWLAALQDYATLTLSQEDASQLPATGGVFFTVETKHQARSHYTSCWAPILHASSLWLQGTGFVMSDEGPASFSRPATPTSMGQSDSVGGAKSPEDISTDRLNLILGISVSFLCSPHPEDQTENITSCLRALQSLLSVSWPRSQVGNDQVLSVELVCVLHRVMMTREGAELHLAVLQLVQQMVLAAQEHVRERRYSAEVDDGACEKENLPEFGEGGDTGGLVPGRSLVLATLELCLRVLLRNIPHLSPQLTGTTRTALDILSHLPSICSPEAPQQKALQALQVVVSSPVGRQEKSEDQAGVDQVGVLRVLNVFLVSAGPEMVLVVSVCLQMLTSVFQVRSGVAVPYIRTLGPLLLRYLQGAERSRPQRPEELQSVLEALRALEALVSASDPVNRPQLMAVFLPILVSFLLDENALSSAPVASRALHEAALKDLMRLGPQFPQVFRAVMSSSPSLKARLQAAIQGNQDSLSAKANAATNRTSKALPSITLKTNFL
ncbi:hypothetical protein NHX12_019423 [Muraenolepis orangiensis]|uniref:HEAT repeat-containing protein 5A n=1 Tax=Muraenolepis orangiensis TaxID=630683 RepID=A0A9Q0EWQ4_9TELE|nr:hypothetical protein NHX12_019423 [Muraenolepis orangiensis]